MTCPTHDSFVYGTGHTASQTPPIMSPPRPQRPAPTPPVATNPLERLSQLMLCNERLMDELAASRVRILDARAYLDDPKCHVRFGEAHLERCRSKHSGILAQLRANRIEALRLLGQDGPAD